MFANGDAEFGLQGDCRFYIKSLSRRNRSTLEGDVRLGEGKATQGR